MGIVFYITCVYYIETWSLTFEFQNMEVNENETIGFNSVGDDGFGFKRVCGINWQ